MSESIEQKLAKSDNPRDFIITRKRKLYKFASFNNLDNCFNESTWLDNQDAILNSGKPINLEIGAGTALFSTKLAQLHPDQIFIAIDRKSDRLYTGAKLANELKLTNAYYIWLNVINLNRAFPDNSISQIWITFPDPWPQESNAKHRLTNAKRLVEYHKLLSSNGWLNFKTDNRPLFDWSISQLNEKWQIAFVTNNLHQNDNAPSDSLVTTTYEERYISEGKPINYLLATPFK